MQKYIGTVQNRNGDAIYNASVTVSDYPSGTESTIYSDNGTTVTTNPLTTDANGNYEFFASNGTYTLTITGSNVVSETLEPIILFDPTQRAINAQTGTSYTLALTDAGKLVTLDNENPVTLTIPPNSNVAFPTSTQIDLVQFGIGTVTVTPGSGVTINSVSALTDLSEQYAAVSLVKTAENTWLLVGNLA